MKTRILNTLAIAATLVGSQAFADNITIPDNDLTIPGGWYYNGGTPTSSIGGEDNESEFNTVRGQSWDMEGLFINGKILSMVGGYDLVNGNEGYTTGDLFIKVRASKPGSAPTGDTTTTVPNSNYSYTFAVDLSYTPKSAPYVITNPREGLLSGSQSASVYMLGANSRLDTVAYDYMKSNPWRYSSGAINTTPITTSNTTPITTSVTYTTGVAAYNSMFLGGDGTHNVTTVNLQFLYDLGYLSATDPFKQGPVWFSYTMKCGNDSIKGEWNNGFDQVPDGSSTIVLIALGIAAGLTQLPRRRRE